MKSLEEKFEMDESLMKEHDDGNITEELSAEKSKTLLQGKGDPLNDREKKEQSDEENYILPAPKLAQPSVPMMVKRKASAINNKVQVYRKDRSLLEA